MKIFVLIVLGLWFALCIGFTAASIYTTRKRKNRDKTDRMWEGGILVLALLSLAAFIFTVVGWN